MLIIFSTSVGFQLKCTSRIHTIYETTVEKSIEEDRPKILASGTSGHNMNLYGPYDQPPTNDEQMMDQNNLHLTHYKSKWNSWLNYILFDGYGWEDVPV